MDSILAGPSERRLIGIYTKYSIIMVTRWRQLSMAENSTSGGEPTDTSLRGHDLAELAQYSVVSMNFE